MPRSCRPFTPASAAARVAASPYRCSDGIADWMAVPLIQREYTGQEPKRLGLAHASIAPYGAYRAGDGAQFIIAVQTEAEWVNLCRGVLDRPDMIDDPRFASNSQRAAHRDELDAEMSAALSRFDAAAMTAALRQGNIAFGRYNNVGEFAGHSQLRRAEVQTQSGPVSVPAPAPVFDGQTPRPRARARQRRAQRRDPARIARLIDGSAPRLSRSRRYGSLDFAGPRESLSNARYHAARRADRGRCRVRHPAS